MKDFAENLIAWDALERLLIALGLQDVIEIEVAKEFVQSIEDSLLDPNQLMVDYLGFNLTDTVETYLETIPDLDSITTALNFEINRHVPLLDFTGPFAFYPSHCYPMGADNEEKGLREATMYNSPVIAYVSTGASIEQDLIQQLRSLFNLQQEMSRGIAITELLKVLGVSEAALGGLKFNDLLSQSTSFVR